MRRGSMIDHIFIGATGVIILIMSLIAVTMFEKIAENDEFSTVGKGGPAFVRIKNDLTATYDWSIPAATLLMYAGVMVLAFLTPNHPVFAVASIGLLVLGSLIMPTMANAYLDMADKDTFDTANTNLPITRFYVEVYPLVFLIMGITMLWAMYMSAQRGF